MTVKICIDCTYFARGGNLNDECRRPLPPIFSTVYGHVAANSYYAEDERNRADGCGPTGKYFEQKYYPIRFWKNK